MAVVEANGTVRTVIEMEPGANWPVPDGCRLVDDVDGNAEPGGSQGRDGFALASRDATFLVGSADNEPARDLEKMITELELRLDKLERAK